MAGHFQHFLDALRQRVRVVLLEPVFQAQLVLVTDVDVDERLPLVVAHDFARYRGPPGEVVDAVEHLQRAGIAFGHQALDVAGVEVAGGEFLGQELVGAFDAAALAVGAAVAQVGDVELRCLAVERPHRRTDAAEVLEGVVGGQHAVEVGSTRQHGALGAFQVFGVEVDLGACLVGAGNTLGAPGRFVGAVGVLHARQVEGCQLPVGFALALPGVGGQRRVVQPGAVAAGFVGEDARFSRPLRGLLRHALLDQAFGDGAAVGIDRVVGLVGAGGQFDRLGQLLHGVREVIAIKTGGREHDVDTRPLELLARHQPDIDDPPAGVPHRLGAHGP